MLIAVMHRHGIRQSKRCTGTPFENPALMLQLVKTRTALPFVLWKLMQKPIGMPFGRIFTTIGGLMAYQLAFDKNPSKLKKQKFSSCCYGTVRITAQLFSLICISAQ
jgi:hypothetical protein